MLQEIKITEISINDKQIVAEAMNQYGQVLQSKYLADSDDRGQLLLFSITQNCFHQLTILFNSKKVLGMCSQQKQEQSRKLTLLTHTALVAISALQHYQNETADPYLRSRCDVLWNKIEKQIV